MQQLTETQAIEIFNSNVWQEWTDKEIVAFQLYQERLCLPFARFHEAIEAVLERSVWTHEFAFISKPNGLQDQYEGKCGKPSMQDIMMLFPKDKPIILVVKE